MDFADKIYGIGRSIRALSKETHAKLHGVSAKTQKKVTTKPVEAAPRIGFKIGSTGDITIILPTQQSGVSLNVVLDLENAS